MRCERMKVDILKITEALNVERCREIPSNVDMKVISIGVDEAGHRTRSCRPDILSCSKPCIVACSVDQFFAHRSNRIGDEQDDSDEKPSVHIHPQYCEE